MKRFSIALACALFLTTLWALCGCQKQEDATPATSTPTPTQSTSAKPASPTPAPTQSAPAQPASPPSPTQKADPDPSQNPASPLYGWINFSPPDGQFSSLFPGQPTKQEQKTDQTKIGEIQTHIFIVETGPHYAYAVAYYDLPKVADPKLVITALETIIEKRGEIVSTKDIQVANYPGADVDFILNDKPKFSCSTRLIVVGQRAYELGMIYFTGDANPDVRDAFFNSFTLQN